MSNFKNIKKLGLSITTWGGDPRTSAVLAQELETLLQSAQVVYGSYGEFSPNNQFGDTHSALLIGISPLKKKTKAEAALELLQEMSKIQGYENWYTSAAKRILEMKDDV